MRPSFANRAFESVAAPVDEKKSTINASECFVAAFELVDVEKLGKEKDGRLARLVYTFETAGFLNNNRRLYPTEKMRAAVLEFAQDIQKDIVFGRLDHPHPYSDEALYVTYTDAAIKVTGCEMLDDKNVRVTVDVLDNDHGRQLLSILKVKGRPAISQRATALWREPTSEERKQHGVPEDTYMVVAERVRLITYDIVSKPGFPGAIGAKVTEAEVPPEGVEMKTVAELKTAHPALYELIVNEAKAAAKAEHDAAMEKARASIVTETEKPLKEKITSLEAINGELKTALGAVKPALVKAGLVNENLTDAQAATKIATTEAANSTLTNEVANLKTQLEAANKQIAAANEVAKCRAALEAVATTFAQHPGKDLILRDLVGRRISDTAAALEAAKNIAGVIEAANPNMRPQGNQGGNGGDGANFGFGGQVSNETLLAGLLSSGGNRPQNQFQNPYSGSGGFGSNNGGHQNGQNGQNGNRNPAFEQEQNAAIGDFLSYGGGRRSI